MKQSLLAALCLMMCLLFALAPGCDCGEESERVEGYETPWGNWGTGNNATSDDCYATVDYLYEICEFGSEDDYRDMIELCANVSYVDWRNCVVTAVRKYDGCSDQIAAAQSCDQFLDEV